MAQANRLTFRVCGIPTNVTDFTVANFLQAALQSTSDAQVRIHVRSLAPAAEHYDRIRKKVATVEFSTLPQRFQTQHRSEWSLISNKGDHLVVDTHFLGLTPLNFVTNHDHEINCIAVCGLAGHPFGSWRQQMQDQTSQQFMWLRDRLPNDVQNVRIMTYGYDTSLVKSASTQSIDDLARAFIEHLKTIASGEASLKPLVIIAHSLGGLIVKRALLYLAGGGKEEVYLTDTVKMLILFGVPNEGMEIEKLQTMVRGQPNEGLVEDLKAGSSYLSLLDEQFSGIALGRKIRVVSAYETKESHTILRSTSGTWERIGKTQLLVSPTSGIQRASQDSRDMIPIDENHSNITKFKPGSPSYMLIRDKIHACIGSHQYLHFGFSEESAVSRTKSQPYEQSIYSLTSNQMSHDGAMTDGRVPDVTLASLQVSLKYEEIDLRLLAIEAASNATFSWILDQQELRFMDWIIGGEGVYWIKGKAGSGKSTLMKYLYSHHKFRTTLAELSIVRKVVDLWFFFSDQGSYLQKTLEGLLRTILYQIITKDDRLASLVLEVYRSMRPDKRHLWSHEDLKTAFSAILDQKQFDVELLLFFDALDEYYGSPQIIADWISSLVMSKNAPSSKTRVKICFSSRPWRAFNERFSSSISFELQAYTLPDMIQYILTRANEPSRSSTSLPRNAAGLSILLSDGALVRSLAMKAEGVFLWVKLAMDELTSITTTSLKQLESIIKGLPKELEDFYRSIIARIPDHKKIEALTVIELVLRQDSQIRTKELYLAAQCRQQKSFAECQDKLQKAQEKVDADVKIDQELLSLCGGLLEVVTMHQRPQLRGDQHVQFIHKSVTDFVRRPEFTSEMLGGRHLVSDENGFTWSLRFAIVLSHGRTDLWEYYIRSARQEEATLGRSSAAFLNSVPHEHMVPLTRKLVSIGIDQKKLCDVIDKASAHDSAFVFSAILGLYLSVRQMLQDKEHREALLSRAKPLHAMMLSYAMSSISAFEKTFKLLLESGFRLGDLLSGFTCWDILFSRPHPNTFTFYAWRDLHVVERVHLLIRDCDQDPNAPIFAPINDRAKDSGKGVLKKILSRIETTKQTESSLDVGTRSGMVYVGCALHIPFQLTTCMLLEAGADPNILDHEGRTALDCWIECILNERREVVMEEKLPRILLDTIRSLLQHGGRLTNRGEQLLPRFLDSLQDLTDAHGQEVAEVLELLRQRVPSQQLHQRKKTLSFRSSR